MPDSLNKHLNRAFMTFPRRSERVDRDTLVSTFVDIGPLFTVMSIHDNQIIYGRRGTGKTHALKYLTSTVQAIGDIAIYVDMSNVGSNSSVYHDNSLSITERATRLLIDTLIALHDGLLEHAVENAEAVDLSKAGPQLDQLVREISEIRIAGPVEREIQTDQTSRTSRDLGIRAEASIENPALRAAYDHTDQVEHRSAEKTVRKGDPIYYVHFGSTAKSIQKVTELFKRRVWLLLDEWSSVPLDLQPYLSDLLRRTLFSNPLVTVKIAAIEHRSSFQIKHGQNEYVGFELGADVTADINLDDFMVFDNDERRSSEFFKEFLFKHLQSVSRHLDIEAFIPKTGNELVRVAFTQQNTFTEYVRAVEGVPRDAINIISSAAQKAVDSPISMEHIRKAAQDWYQMDKQRPVQADAKAQNLLEWIIHKVIGNRRARAFLLKSGSRDELIERLFDARVLHVLKKNISTRDQPGMRYNVFKLDYGCYVDLINTQKAPQGLLPFLREDGSETFIDVPPDDYRAIRRAILDLNEFDRAVEARENRLHLVAARPAQAARPAPP